MKHRFIKNRDLVLFSHQHWNSDIGFNFKDMAYELARYNRVLFVNRAVDRNSMLRNASNKIDAFKKTVVAETPNLVVVQNDFWLLNPSSILESVNWLPSYTLFNYFNRINNVRLAGEINKAITELGFNNVILINDNDFYRGVSLKELMPSCKTYIFYIRDFLTIQSFFKKFGPRMEKRMIENADLVVANSAYLADHARQWNTESYDIGQGCDFSNLLAVDFPVPDDMKTLPKPIIGYCGAITSMRLDHSILVHIAESFPQCSLVLVGPADDYFSNSPLKNYPNVFLLGGKPPHLIQNYMSHFDICINPQSINPLTIGNYPRKIDEYLALGKPVVATDTAAMQMFSAHTVLCQTKEDYSEAIREILAGPKWFSEEEQQKRRDFALEHTWENSIGCMGDAYYQTVESNLINA